MHLVIIDNRPEFRAALMGRVREAIRQAELKRCNPIELDRNLLDRFDWSLAQGVILGPGCHSELPEILKSLGQSFSGKNIAVVLPREEYRVRAAQLRVDLGVYTMAEGDLAQIVSFVLECAREDGRAHRSSKNRGIVSVGHFKGGSGSTAIALALGVCWAKNGLQVALVDLDDITTDVTIWSRAGDIQRSLVSDFIRRGEVPPGRINEILFPVDGFPGLLYAVPQPKTYGDSFQFKSNAIPGAPGIRTYIESLLQTLQAEFDVVIVDLGNSWGTSTFVALSMSQRILLTVNDDPWGVQLSLESCERLLRETNNDSLLGIRNWSVVLNGYTGHGLLLGDLKRNLEKLDLFPPSRNIFVVPFAKSLKNWAPARKTLYDVRDGGIQERITEMAQSCVPFVTMRKESYWDRLKTLWPK